MSFLGELQKLFIKPDFLFRPYQVALRVGNSIKITHGQDLSLSFNIDTNFLSVTVSPFYFASTGGLLGKFDNEPHFDLAGPNGDMTTDVPEFAYAWEVRKLEKCAKLSRLSSRLN